MRFAFIIVNSSANYLDQLSGSFIIRKINSRGWKYLYDYDVGFINFILRAVGIGRQPFIASAQQALPSVAGVFIWATVGFQMIIFLAALQEIPKELYESSEIDGANNWQQFRYVTFPMLRNVSLFVVIVLLINAFREFIVVFIMTEGGPAQSTYLMVYYIWRTGFWFYKLGRASAISMILFIIILLLTFLNFRLFRFGSEEK